MARLASILLMVEPGLSASSVYFLKRTELSPQSGVTLRDRFRSNHALHATAEVEPIPTWLNERWDMQDSPDLM